MDSRIGVLNSGMYYTFSNGYDAEPVTGTLKEVMSALGISHLKEEQNCEGVASHDIRGFQSFTVLITFEHPAWNEREGIEYQGISAKTKREAIRIVRSLAESDGHLGTGRGRYWLKAVLQ